MKIKITFFTILISVLVGFSSVYSQSTEMDLLKNLTTEQKQMLLKQRELIKEHREAIKATLSKEQLEILKNLKLSKKERQNALRLTFTDAQKTILVQNKLALQNLKSLFKSTLTTDQIQQLRLRAQIRNTQESNELKRTVKDRRKIKRNRN